MAIRLTFLIISLILCGASAQNNRLQRQTLAPTASPPPPTQEDEIPSDFSNIDMLRELYIKLEKSMWRVIRAGVGQEYVLQRIHAVHLRFFAEKFNENGVYLDLFDPDQSTLHNEIEKVNLTINSARNVHLNTNINDNQRDQVLDFSRNTINMTKTMDIIYSLTRHRRFFEKKFYLQNDALQHCLSTKILTESTNQKLYEYYVDISAAQLKAYSLTQMSYMFLTVYNQNNSELLAENLRMLFNERTISTQERVRDLMNQSGRETWNCDQPIEYRLKGVSNQVTKLLQGYVDNEANLNPIRDCKKTCTDYTLTKNYQCYNGSLCDPARGNNFIRKCSGNIVNCQFFEGDMKICPSIIDRSRSYNYIKLSSGVTLGKAGPCEAEEAETKSFSRWFVQCSNCFCYCDEESKDSDRYFSLQPVLSDTERNMVITGVSIVKDRQTFYWKITQRKLIGKGQVESTATSTMKPYKSVRTINVRDDPTLKEGIDFHTLSYENRSVNLDTLVAPPGSVITGIKFKYENGRLGLEIRSTKFDFDTGMTAVRSEWFSNTVPDTNRIPILLEYPDKSDRSILKSKPDITSNSYIDFQPTDIGKDAAQSTVPFIDTELVEPTHPTILSGIGLYYKGQPGYGGFIAPKIVTYDFAPHIKVGPT